jgi:hypothetical protein
MAERSEKAQARVREELQKNPGASTKELQAAATSADAAVGELSLRQFNAGYVLPIKRRSSGGRKKSKSGGGARRQAGRKQSTSTPAAPRSAPQPRASARAAAPVSDRDRARAVLLEFARDFSEAESRSAIVGVLSELDRYVDRIVGSRG